MMKRLISILLTALFIGSPAVLFSSCENPDAYEAYQAAWEKSGTLDAIDSSYEMKFDMESSDLSMKTSISGKIQAELDKGAPKTFYTENKSKIFGMTTKTTAYYQDGVLYTKDAGGKYKMEAPLEQLSEQTMMLEVPSWLNLEEDVFLKSSLKKENGSQVFTATVDGVQLMETLKKELLKSAQSSSGSFTSSEDEAIEESTKELQDMYEEMLQSISLSNIELRIVITPDGYIGEEKISMTVECKDLSKLMGGISQELLGEDELPDDLTIQLSFGVSFHNPGQPVEVTVPENLEDYEDLENYFNGLDGQEAFELPETVAD